MTAEINELLKAQAEKVQHLDPLKADAFFVELPSLNIQPDPSQLIYNIQTLIPSPDKLSSFTEEQCLAAKRDLGIAAASIKRHGYEPCDVVDGLQTTLLTLGNRTSTVPRETVYEYGPLNPTDSRMRCFTDLPEERLFINSFREGMSHLDHTVESLVKARSMDPNELSFAQACEASAVSFEGMIRAMAEVRRSIPAEIFTYQLRPYFEPIRIGNQYYDAPGGAQMRLLDVDAVIWGSDNTEPQYLQYRDRNLAYCPQDIRIQQENNLLNESLMTKVLNSELDGIGQQSVESLINLMNKLISFRRLHYKVAQENFALRKDGDLGSGGYSPDILIFLLSKIETARDDLKNLI